MRRALRYLFLTIVGVVVVAGIALATPPGRAVVARMIERAASGNGLTVSIGSLSGWPPFWLGADSIVLSDADGPFAEINNLSVDVTVTALLTGSLALDAIAAERVKVTRQPHLAGGGNGALLPFAAETFSVARLELGEALVARAAALAATGSFASGANGSIAARLNAERIDGVAGTLTATIERANADAPLGVDVTLTEAADGVLVGLMGRRSGPGYTLAAKTGLTGDALEGSVALSSEGAARFSGRFTLSPLDNTGRLLVLTGDGDLAELVPPEYADLLSGPINVAVDADWTSEAGNALPRIAVRQGTITTGSVRAEASGALGDASADLALKIDVAKPGGGTISLPALSPPSRFESIALTGKVAPSADAIRLDLAGRVAGLQVGDVAAPGVGVSLAVEAKRDDPLAGGKLPFAVRVEADAVQTPSGRIEAVAGAPLILTADGTFDTATLAGETTASLAAAGGRVGFAGTFSAEGATGKATVDYADLRPLSPLAGRAISGGLVASAEGTFSGGESQFNVAATSTDPNPGDATVARLLAGETHFAATVSRQAGGRAAVSDLSVDGVALKATGGIAITADAVDGTLEGGIADLSLLADASSGAATFNAKISGSPARPTVDATIAIAEGRLLDQPVDKAVVHLQGAPSDTGWQARLTLEGGFAGKPLSGQAGASLDQATGLLAFPDVDLTIGDNRVTGAIQRTAEGPLSGTLNVDAPNLQTLAALALINASGGGEARVEFLPDGKRQSLSVAFTGSDLAYQTVAAGEVEGNVRIDDAFGAPLIQGNATASAMAVGGLRLDTMEVTASVESGATKFQATARGRDVNLSGGGSLAGVSGGQVVRVDALTGSAFGLPVLLSAPVTVRLDAGQAGIVGADLALGGGHVRVDGAVSPELNLTVIAEGVSASALQSLAPQIGAEGTISGRATIIGKPASPAFAWQANWSGLRVAATRSAGLPGLTLAGRGVATMSASSIEATLIGAGLSLAITGQIPFTGAGLGVRAQGTAPLALLALESNRELRLAGTARVDLSLSGALSAPQTSGTVDLADATIADTESGFGIAGATGRIAFDGRRATIRQLGGRLAQGGQITVAGSVAIDGAGLPADLTVRIANGRYADGNVVNAAFNAELVVKGPLLGNGVVSGQINLGRTEIQLPDKIGGSATAIDVRHANVKPGFKAPKLRQSAGASGASGGGTLRLDIALAGNSGIFVRGFGIDAELGGTLRVTGTSGNPQAIGAFTMQRGRIEMLGKRFDFTRGTLTFAGDLIPVIDFAATTSTSDSTVTLHVSGPANDPSISFTSSPALPEEEILSRLLFDRNVGSLSPLQAAQLVDAVAQMTGALGGTGLFARVRQATGLDDLDVRQSATGGTTVGVSKRINDRVRLGVEAGTDASAGRVTIDLDITKNLKARGEAGQDGSGKVGLTYEREY